MSLKGNGCTPKNSGEYRGIVHRCHDFHKPDGPLWSYVEAHGWTQEPTKGEWELRRYRRGSELAIFHFRQNGNVVMSGHSKRLARGYFQSLKDVTTAKEPRK